MPADTLLRSRHAAAVGEASDRARRLGRPVLASWTEPSSLDAMSLFAQAPNSADRALWLRQSSGEALVGVGAARTLSGRGAGRFKHVDQAWRELLADAVVQDGIDARCGGPLLMGGFSFDPIRRQETDRWSAFPDARLVLPQLMLSVRDGSAWLTTNLLMTPDGVPETPRQYLTAEARCTPPAVERSLSSATWKTLVGSVALGIRTGKLGIDKVVLARAEQIQHAASIDPRLVLRRLADGYPSCTVFAVAHGEACFLGATPERLISLRNGTASTLALAGSRPRGATPDGDVALARQLMQDPKDRAEHAIVVAALRRALAEVCTQVVGDTQPRLEQLTNVQHLLTRLRGQVGPGRSILDLVERIHPTPAVGGFPRQQALELIRECEMLDRGWYAGPIGWVDRYGEGEFVVGIRSALLHGSSATVFAGCGIVADSDPNMEYAESGWKLQPMLAALSDDR